MAPKRAIIRESIGSGVFFVGGLLTAIVSIKDVARRAGVSPKTVSRAINGEVHGRAEVRHAVQRIVDEVGYRPNAFPRSLSSSQSYLIGLFIDDPGSGYAADVQLGALKRCRERSDDLVVEPVDMKTGGWREQVADSLAALRLEVAIMTPPLYDHGGLLDVLDAAESPYVRISPREGGDRSAVVRMDHRAAAFEMTGHLLALGRFDVDFIRGDPNTSASLLHYESFRAAVAAADLAVERVFERDLTLRAGIEPGEQVLRARPHPTAMFASNDDMALGVLIAAMKLDVSVPEQLSIAGFDDALIARASSPQLTTIRQPKAEMAAAAVDVLVDPTYRTSKNKAAQRLLELSLISRMSTSRPVTSF